MRKRTMALGLAAALLAAGADWTRATEGPESAWREAFYKQVQALVDAGG